MHIERAVSRSGPQDQPFGKLQLHSTPAKARLLRTRFLPACDRQLRDAHQRDSAHFLQLPRLAEDVPFRILGGAPFAYQYKYRLEIAEMDIAPLHARHPELTGRAIQSAAELRKIYRRGKKGAERLLPLLSFDKSFLAASSVMLQSFLYND
jgi:hypothetical protein